MGDAEHLKRRPERASLRPTTSATRPPMPASTSSKISPGADALGGRSSASLNPWRDVAVSVLMASMTRDSSPPETMRASGRRSSPGFGDTKNSAWSMPRARPRRLRQRLVVEPHLEPRLLHRQIGEQPLERRAKSTAAAPSRRRQRLPPPRDTPSRGRVELALELARCVRRRAPGRSSSRRSASRRAIDVGQASGRTCASDARAARAAPRPAAAAPATLRCRRHSGGGTPRGPRAAT